MVNSRPFPGFEGRSRAATDLHVTTFARSAMPDRTFAARTEEGRPHTAPRDFGFGRRVAGFDGGFGASCRPTLAP